MGSSRWLSLLFVLVACKQSQAPASKPPAANSAPVASAVVVKPALPPPLTQAEVDQVLNAWEAAQNNGVFADYEKLYASKFFGVKRAGERVKRFDRTGWLADRQRMFQKPISVDASEIVVRPGPGSAAVTFTQRWISGKFEDKGRKRLLIMREGDQLKIAQEEMLDSLVLASPALGRPVETFHFTLAYQSGLYLAMPEQARLTASGPARIEHALANESLHTASRAVQDDALPAELASWKGRRVKLDDGCVGTVSEFRLLVRVEDGFGTLRADAAEAELEEAIFSLGEPFVVAKVDGCKTGEYARPESALPPTAAEHVSDDVLELKAKSAFAALPSVQESQRSFLKEVDGASGQWWDERLKVAVYRHPLSKQVLVSVSADNGATCAEFGASVWAIFQVQGSTLQKLREDTAPAEIAAVLDVDADGHLEFLTHGDFRVERALVVPHSNQRDPTLTYDFHGCGC